jgi:hypothetical protein
LLQIIPSDRTKFLKSDLELSSLIKAAALEIVTDYTTGKVPEINAILEGIGEEIPEEIPIHADPPLAACPHGREYHDCNDCMIASDLAFDAMRERGGR